MALVLLQAQVQVHGLPILGADDANIFMTYGRNLSRGAGFVYTPGFERVEGATSLLYVAVCAAAASTPWPEAALALFCFVTFVVTVVAVLGLAARLAREDSDGGLVPRSALAMALWAGLHPGLSFWGVLSLLDTGLWTMLVVLSASVALRVGTPGFAGLWTWLSVALAVARPEALLLVPAFTLVAAWLARKRSLTWPQVVRATGPGVAGFVVAEAGLVLGRLLYFGFPLPNTFYAKVGSDWLFNLSEGFRYGAQYLLLTPLSAVLLVVAGRCLVVGLRPAGGGRQGALSTESVAVAALALVCWGLPLVAGGDHFPQGRFLTAATWLLPLPALATVGVSSPRSLRVGWARWAPVLGTLLAAGAAHLLLSRGFEGTSQDAGRELVAAERGRRVGRALNRAFGAEGPSVGAFVVGGLGYEYQGRVTDLLGLNNVDMAHASRSRYGPKNHAGFDREVFFRLRPELLPLGFVRSGNTTDLSFLRQVTGGMIDDPRFRREYAEVVLVRGDLSQAWLENPDFFVPPRLRGAWGRSEGGPEAYGFLQVFARRDLLGKICTGDFRARVVGPGCEVAREGRTSLDATAPLGT